jgi:tetratricopeptide (TPR) repeat protein
MDDGVGLAEFSAEDCRKLLSDGHIAEGLAALQGLARSDPDNATVHHYLAVALHMSGRSGESLPHFDRAIALDPQQPSIYQNQAIALLTAGEVDRSLDAAEKAIALRPESIGGYVNLALARIRLKDYDAASRIIDRGLAIAPDHPGLLTQASHLAIEMQDWVKAERFVAAALEVAPASVDALYNAGMLHQYRARDIEALKAFDQILAIQPRHEASFVNKGVSLRNLGRADEALRHFTGGLGLWPDWDVLKYNVAITRLYLKQWPEAWADYELRSSVAGSLDKTTRPTTPLWDGSDLRNGTLLIIHEQGFGDTFQFIRFIFATVGKAERVIFLCQKRLYNLLSRLDIFQNGKVQLVADDGQLPEHDCHIPLMSLPRMVRLTPQAVPVGVCRMDVEPQRLQRWKAFGTPAIAERSMRIGIAWQGNPKAPVDRGRSIPLAEFAPLAKLGDKVRLISLQRFFGLDQVVPAGLDVLSPDGDFDAGDDAFVDTAAMMMTLDLIVTSDTATAHLAGLLGRPVWLILKHVPDWRWGGEGLLTEWYPTMRLYRQKSPGDWEGCLTQLADDVDRLIPGKAAAHQSAGVPEAIKLHMQGRFREALDIYRAEHTAGRRDPQFLNFLAMAILEAGKRSKAAAEEALPFAARSVSLAPGMGDYWSNFAVLLDSLPSRSDAKRALRFALTVNPEHAPSLISLAKRESGDGNSQQALQSLKGLLAREPNQVPALSALAAVYSDLKQYKESERALRRALELQPEDAKLWVQLGAAQSANEKPFDAAISWERALFHEPGNADAFSNLGVHERTYGALGLSCYLQRRAVECDPNHAEAWNNLGIAELEATHDQASIGAFSRAIAVRPGYPDAHLALGMALLNGGDFANGLKHYEWRLMAEKLGITANRPKLPLWRGGDPKGKSFLLMAEQGFGDAFQFSRYAAWLKEHGATKVFIGCRDKIAHLLRTIPGVDDVYGEGAKLPPADALIYMMSMPALSGMRLETIPAYGSYMTADPARVTRWAQWLAQKPGFRVGVVWQGNPDPKVDKGRSYPLAALEPLSKIPGVRLIALQKGAGEEQIEALEGRFAVERPGDDYDSGADAFADTAAMMMNVDLIVTSDTAVATLPAPLAAHAGWCSRPTRNGAGSPVDPIVPGIR